MALLFVVLAAPAQAAAPESCGAPKPAKVITGTFTTEQTGSFVLLPFDVPKGTTAIRGWYCYDQPDSPTAELPAFAIRHTIDFGYYAPGGRFRGWSGSGYFKDITVSREGYSAEPDPSKKPFGSTSRGYRPGPIKPGRWNVELGVAAVVPPSQGDSDGSVDWRVELQLETAPVGAPYERARYDARPRVTKPGWYAGDFHVHSDQSGDAKHNAPAKEVFDYAFGPAGLDFVQVTDHNTDGGWGEWGRFQSSHPAKLIARNEEITTYRGHVNAPGIRRWIDYHAGPERPVSEIFRAVHAAGGVTQINHPTIFDSSIPPFGILCRGCSWEYDDEETDYSQVDAIEVETGPQGLKTGTMPGPSPFTPLAIQFYEEALAKAGHVIAAVSGSDSHTGGDSSFDDVTGSPVGSPATMVYARELSERGIADAIRAGHTYVRSFGIAGPELEFTAGDAIMGDTVRAESATFAVKVTGGGAGPEPLTVQVTKNGAVMQVSPASELSFAAEAPATGTDRYGVQIMRGSAIEAIATPIFLTREAAVPLRAHILQRARRGVVRVKLSGDGLRGARVNGRRVVAYRDGIARTRLRVRRGARLVRVRAVALGAGTRSPVARRRVVVAR